jgi:hypothetical protein
MYDYFDKSFLRWVLLIFFNTLYKHKFRIVNMINIYFWRLAPYYLFNSLAFYY